MTKDKLIEARSDDGGTPLLYAARAGRLDAVKLLLEKGAVVDAKGKRGVSALRRAAQYGHLEVVQLLLEKGAMADGKDDSGITPLLVAAGYGDPEVVRLFLERGAAVNAHDNKNVSPLEIAAQNGHLEVVALLMKKGAAVDANENNKATPFMIAAQNWNPNEEKRLLARSASANLPPPMHPTMILSGDKNGRQPVVGVSGKKPEIMVDGNLKKLSPDAGFTFARAKDYAPGKVEIRDLRSEHSTYELTNLPGGATIGQGDRGIYISADIIPALSYDDCYYVIALSSRSNLFRGAKDPQMTFLFRDLGHLAAGQKKEILVDVDGDETPLLLLVFSKGLEIESNQTPMAAEFFRQEELGAHRRRLVTYFSENRTGDAPLRNYFTIPPVFPRRIPLDTLPAKIDASCTISCAGLVESVELPHELPAPAAQEIARAVSGWLFLPELQHGIPQATTIQIPISLREECPAH